MLPEPIAICRGEKCVVTWATRATRKVQGEAQSPSRPSTSPLRPRPRSPAGETEITLTNEGKEPHQLLMALLTEDAPDVEKLLELPQKKAESYFAEEYNQLEKPIKPGESASATVDLKPGTYAYVCFVESKKEKAPHAFLGMVGQLTVE